MLKILQARLQQHVNHELPDIQAGFRKCGGTRGQTANICWIIKKAREFQINIYLCFIYYSKAYYCVDQNKLWKILKDMGIPGPPDSPPEKLYAGQKARVRTVPGQQTGSKLGKKYVKAVYSHPAYLTYMQSTS